MRAGGTLGSMSYKVLDAAGEEIAFDPSWFQRRSSGMDVSWAAEPGQRREKIITTEELPAVKVLNGYLIRIWLQHSVSFRRLLTHLVDLKPFTLT